MISAAPVLPSGAGAVLSIPYGPVAEWLAGAGYSWLIIDAEHAPIGPAEQLALVTATHAAGATAFVRVAVNDVRSIGIALDAGADGVIVPDIRSALAAASAAAACRYPPAGTRSIGPIRRQASTPACIVQIEAAAAVEQAQDIASVEGVHALMIGPGDLALDAGLLAGIDSHHATMVDHYDEVRRAAVNNGLPAGTFALLGSDDVSQAVAFGWDFVAACLDRIALITTASSLRAATDQKVGGSNSSERRSPW